MEGSKDKFSSLMRKGKLEMPFSDFEENTMKRIQAESKYKTSILHSFRISFIFFVLGTGFGLIVNNILANADNLIMGIEPDTVLMVFQMAFVLIFIMQSENIYKLFTKLKND